MEEIAISQVQGPLAWQYWRECARLENQSWSRDLANPLPKWGPRQFQKSQKENWGACGDSSTSLVRSSRPPAKKTTGTCCVDKSFCWTLTSGWWSVGEPERLGRRVASELKSPGK